MVLLLDTERTPMLKLFHWERGSSGIYEDYGQYIYRTEGRELFAQYFEMLLMRYEQ